MGSESDAGGSQVLNALSSSLDVDSATKKLAAEFERDIKSAGELEVCSAQIEVLLGP
jgi:hypothetical protein